MQCRLCGNSELKLFYTQGNEGKYRFYRCPECSLVNLDMSEGLDQEKYGEAFIEHSDESAKQNRMQKRSWLFIRDLLPAGTKGMILDIGCGNGSLLHMAMKDGWIASGMELLPELAEGASRSLGIEVLQCDFQEFEPNPCDRYDLIVMRHVLEHIPDCNGTIGKCTGMLTPGGSIYLELPNINGISFRMKRLSKRLGIRRHRYRTGYVPGHCNEFCRSSMEYLARSAGLRLVHWSTYSSKSGMDFLYRMIPTATKARVLLSVRKD